MARFVHKTPSYYMVRNYLHPKVPQGYRNNLVLLTVSNNNESGEEKFLIVQQKNGFWTLPKKLVASENVFDGVVDSIANVLDTELGFHGAIPHILKPEFLQVAYLFGIDKQTYEPLRAEYEKKPRKAFKG